MVPGLVLADGAEGDRFSPIGLRFFTLRRSVRLIESQAFHACTQCGHVWSTLDATDLRELIDGSGTEELKQSVQAASSHSVATNSRQTEE
jgi:Zn-finger nucleic acid-binding protein